MPNRMVFVVLAIVLCATAAFGGLDVATEIVSPRTQEPPGLVPVIVKLTNQGDVPALVPRLDVKITGGYDPDYRENIAIPVGANQLVTGGPWAYSGGTETCTAYITYPEDVNHHNDTDVVIVNAAGISGRAEMGPSAGMSLTLLPSPLAGNVLHIEYSLTQAGPAKVTLFDVSGQVVAVHDFIGTRRGELPLYLRHVRGGVYVARLDDGRSAVTRKLVVQR